MEKSTHALNGGAIPAFAKTSIQMQMCKCRQISLVGQILFCILFKSLLSALTCLATDIKSFCTFDQKILNLLRLHMSSLVHSWSNLKLIAQDSKDKGYSNNSRHIKNVTVHCIHISDGETQNCTQSKNISGRLGQNSQINTERKDTTCEDAKWNELAQDHVKLFALVLVVLEVWSSSPQLVTRLDRKSSTQPLRAVNKINAS